jgi:hypothetical protein
MQSPTVNWMGGGESSKRFFIVELVKIFRCRCTSYRQLLKPNLQMLATSKFCVMWLSFLRLAIRGNNCYLDFTFTWSRNYSEMTRPNLNSPVNFKSSTPFIPTLIKICWFVSDRRLSLWFRLKDLMQSMHKMVKLPWSKYLVVKACMKHGGEVPYILNSGTRWKWLSILGIAVSRSGTPAFELTRSVT